MSDQETKDKPSVIGELIGVLQDHWDLFLLELGFESRQAARRLWAIVVAVAFLGLALALLQVALLSALRAAGLSLTAACLWMGGGYAVLGLLILAIWGRRDRRAGGPFDGTRREVGRSLQWIRKLFS